MQAGTSNSEGRRKFEGSRRFSEVRSYWGGLARLLEMKDVTDPRGSLVETDVDELPFEPRRSFVIHDVPAGGVRGGHAHARGQQLLTCLAGVVSVEMRHAGGVHRVELSARTQALLLTAGVWAQQRYSGPGAVLLVLASERYDAGSYLPEVP